MNVFFLQILLFCLVKSKKGRKKEERKQKINKDRRREERNESVS
jgi:hypothetical protein